MSHSGLKTNPKAVSTTAVNPALAVVIGRFQPLHAGHLVLIRKALSVAPNVLILVGSSHQARTIKNPFSYEERHDMIVNSLDAEERTRVVVWALTDNLYSDDEWMLSVQESVKKAKAAFQHWTDHGGDGPTILVGNKKDESSYYLDLFPQYHSVSLGEFKLGFDATQVRRILFAASTQLGVLKSMLSEYTYKFLTEKFISSAEYQRLNEEYWFLHKYKESWSKVPYPVIFSTVDAIVKKSGHIIMVTRKRAPGKDLLALPGGFVNQNETLKQAAIRELVEETNIDLPPAILNNSVKDMKVFDHPDRDPRGRVISNVFLFDLDAADKKYGLPKLKAGDDASESGWLEISTVLRDLRTQIYADHTSIIREMLNV